MGFLGWQNAPKALSSEGAETIPAKVTSQSLGEARRCKGLGFPASGSSPCGQSKNKGQRRPGVHRAPISVGDFLLNNPASRGKKKARQGSGQTGLSEGEDNPDRRHLGTTDRERITNSGRRQSLAWQEC